jgi:hypothetical protein
MQGRTGNFGNVAIATRLFLRMRNFFLKNVWYFEDIFRELEAFLKI